MYVVTADQRSSRNRADGVPGLLRALEERAGPGPLRAFERTAGDEVQALFDHPRAVVDAVVQLLRVGGWWVGIGVGPVQHPLPRTARAGRGPAYVAARAAVESAKSSAAGLCIAGPPEAARAEAAAWLLASLLARRTPEGWEVVNRMTEGARQIDVAGQLGISPQAVSRRLRVAGWTEERRGRDLLSWLLAQADQPQTGPSDAGQEERG